MVLSNFRNPFLKTGNLSLDKIVTGLPINCLILVLSDEKTLSRYFFHKILNVRAINGAQTYYSVSDEIKNEIVEDLTKLDINYKSWEFISQQEEIQLFSNKLDNLNKKKRKLLPEYIIAKDHLQAVRNITNLVEASFQTGVKVDTCIYDLNYLIKKYNFDYILRFLRTLKTTIRILDGFNFIVLNKNLVTEQNLKQIRRGYLIGVVIDIIDAPTANISYFDSRGKKNFEISNL